VTEQKLVFLFRLHPAFCLGHGLTSIGYKDFFSSLDGKKYKVFDGRIVGWDLIYMAVETVVFFVATLAVEGAIKNPAVIKFVRSVLGT
jgi:hypothetical protein